MRVSQERCASTYSVRYFSLEIQYVGSNEIGRVLTIFELCLQKSGSQILEHRHYLVPRCFTLTLNANEKLFFFQEEFCAVNQTLWVSSLDVASMISVLSVDPMAKYNYCY
uniref:Uncharacterized protein n=1 Tax=Parascaris equorum TaxID=6256 RepID=A0A914SK04_PAREQ